MTRAAPPAPRIAAASRRGVALLTALVALLLLALLAVGSMHVGRGDFQRTRDAGVMRRAANAADAGAYDILRRWGTAPYAATLVGGTIGPDTLRFSAAMAVTRTMRTSATSFWTESEGRAGDSLARTLARRAVHVAFRLATPDLPVTATLVARDSVELVDSARVVGTDTSLVAWGATCALAAAVAAVALPDTTRLCDAGCGGGRTGGRLAGVPPLLEDSSAADTARYRVFGRETWATLTRHAAIVLPGGSVVTPSPRLSGASCDRSFLDNWGAPGGGTDCALYAPIIWVRGDLELRGGVGQGVLLVDGDLTLSGGAWFAGVVIAGDDVQSSGVGGTVLGTVMAGDATLAAGDHTVLGGSTHLQLSRCAIDRALTWSARLVPVRQRAWAALRD
ncbi:MAG: hypothetical protein IPF98_23315 [Gemmatimonadetes bacterium]|nr:hypothetical protein [Gemmatimonadota bacterium]